jgi:hypothetical protein
VVVHIMDRLARNLDDLRALVQGLTHKGVRVEFDIDYVPPLCGFLSVRLALVWKTLRRPAG